GGAEARTRPPRRGAVGVGELLPGPRPPPSAPDSGPLRVPHAAGIRSPELAADRTGRRRVLPEAPGRRRGTHRRGQRSARLRPLAHRTDRVAGRPALRGDRGEWVPGAGPGASTVEPARLGGRRPARRLRRIDPAPARPDACP